MADFDSSLPVRTQTNGDVVAALADGTINTQLLAIDASGRITTKLDDGSGNAITSQVNGAQRALDVGIDVGGVQIDPRSIRALTSADIVTVAAITAALPAGANNIGSVNQGTSPWISKDQSDGPVAPGTVASFSSLIGGQFNTVLPTLTNGQQAALQVNSSGELLVATVSSDDHNYGTVGASTLRAAAQIGNATGAADFNAGATGAQTLRVVANQGAPNTAGNAWFVHPTDGTNNQVFTATGQATVSVTSPLPTGTNSIGTVVVSNFPTTADTNYGTVGANTIRTASEIGNATGAANFNNGATGAQTLRVAANLAVGGADVTAANPVPVTIESAPGTHINNYKDAASIAGGGSDNHDYTVTAGKTLHLNQVEGSASGKAKMMIQVETGVASNTFTTYFVQFNSTATPNMSIELSDDIVVAAGVRVRVIMSNRDNQSEDLYSTICGYEI